MSIFDTFDRASYPDVLGTSTSGHTWVVYQGSWQVADVSPSGDPYAQALSAVGTNLAGFDFGVTDGSVAIKVRPGDQSFGIFFRRTSNTEYFFAGDGALFDFSGGSNSQLALYSTGNLNDNDWLRAVFTGSDISVFVNNVLACQVTDTGHSTGTIHGIRSRFTGTSRFREFNNEPGYANWRIGMLPVG